MASGDHLLFTVEEVEDGAEGDEVEAVEHSFLSTCLLWWTWWDLQRCVMRESKVFF